MEKKVSVVTSCEFQLFMKEVCNCRSFKSKSLIWQKVVLLVYQCSRQSSQQKNTSKQPFGRNPFLQKHSCYKQGLTASLLTIILFQLGFYKFFLQQVSKHSNIIAKIVHCLYSSPHIIQEAHQHNSGVAKHFGTLLIYQVKLNKTFGCQLWCRHLKNLRESNCAFSKLFKSHVLLQSNSSKLLQFHRTQKCLQYLSFKNRQSRMQMQNLFLAVSLGSGFDH